MTQQQHDHEKWQILDDGDGNPYCGACGAHVPEQLGRDHDTQCEATTDRILDPRKLCHCRDRADVAAAKAAGPVFLDLDDLDDLEDALAANLPDVDDEPVILRYDGQEERW